MPTTSISGSPFRMNTHLLNSYRAGRDHRSLRGIVWANGISKHFTRQSRAKNPRILVRFGEFQGLTSGGSPQASSQPIENAQNGAEYLWKNATTPLLRPLKRQGAGLSWDPPLASASLDASRFVSWRLGPRRSDRPAAKPGDGLSSGFLRAPRDSWSDRRASGPCAVRNVVAARRRRRSGRTWRSPGRA
jgi:hypothetical protein